MRPGINAHHLTTDDLANRAPVLPRIARLLKPYRGKIVLVLIAVVLAAGLTTLLPFLTRAVFDHALFPVNGSKPHLHLLVWLVVGMCVIPVVASLISIGQNWLTSTIGNSAMADLRGDLFEHLQTMELAFFTATKTGAIQSRLANDVAGVRTVLTDTATTIVQNTVVVSAAFVSMVVLSWQLTALTLMMLPLFLVLQAGVGRRRQRLARRTQESLSEMTAITEEALSVSGILLAKVFNRHDAEVQRYREANRRQTRLQVEQAMTGRTFFAVVQTTFAITPAILYLASGWLITGQAPVAGEALTAGTLVAFTTLQARLQMPLLQLMRVTLDVQTSLALFRRIFEYVDLDPAIKDRPGAVHLPASEVRGRVELDRVWFRYPEPRKLSGSAPTERFPASLGEAATATADPAVPAPTVPDEPMAAEVTPAEPTGTGRHRADVEPDAGWALQDVSLVVEPGQLAAIVGPSGSGKTTTTYLIPRFFDVTRGAVRIDGHDVRDLTLASLADIVGMVTQEPYLFHGTIRENLAYAKPDATTEEIERAARDANIHERIIGFPLGYETITGERGYRLSGGEKQRLAIARVLLKDPPILILDEATSSLDNETERLVQEALERATRSRTTIAIAHRLSTIRSSDVIFGLVDGTVVERGTHEDLLADPGGIYSRLWQEQLRARR